MLSWRNRKKELQDKKEALQKRNYSEPLSKQSSATLKHKFGITGDEYMNLYKAQEERCAICKRHQSEFSRRFAVDHNHDTGRIRGLLCSACNVFLGGVEDRIDYLENAVAYLRKDESASDNKK